MRKLITPEIEKIIRFGVVGIMSNAIGYSLYLLFTWLGVPYMIATTVLYIIGTIMGYFGNKKFTFGDTQQIHKTIFWYVLAYLGGYLILYAMLYVFVERMHVFHAYVQLVAIVVVAVYLFFMMRFVVFKERI
jgi:putative flippase GtrA